MIATAPAIGADRGDSAKTLAYIRRASSTLTRSATDCASYQGPYHPVHPVLYLPHDLPMPDAARDFEASCANGSFSLTRSQPQFLSRAPSPALSRYRAAAARRSPADSLR